MSIRTALIDQVSLLLLFIGALANSSIHICRVLGIALDDGILVMIGPMFWCGLAAWLILPAIRKRIAMNTQIQEP